MTLLPEVVSAIVTFVAFENDGATLDDFIKALPDHPEPQEVQRWLDELVAAQLLDRIAGTSPQRYMALEAANVYLPEHIRAALAAASAADSAGSPETAFAASPETSPAASPVAASNSIDSVPPEASRKRRTSRTAEPSSPGKVIAKVIKEALGGSSASGAGAGSRDRTAGVPKSAIDGIAKLLSAGFSTVFPGRLSPTLKAILTATIGALLFTLYTVVRGSPWLVITVGLVVVAGALAMGHVVQGRGTVMGSMSGTGKDAVSDSGAASSGSDAGARQRTFRGILVVAASVAAIVLILGARWYWSRRIRPPTDLVTAYILNQFAPLPVAVAGLDLKYGEPTEVGCPVTLQARVVTKEPLYRAADTAEYLRTHAAMEMTAIAAANRLLDGPDGAHLRAALGAAFDPQTGSQPVPGTAPQIVPTTAPGAAPQRLPTAPSPPLEDITLVTTQTPPGASVVVSGTLLAWRNAGTWGFSGDLHWNRATFEGKRNVPNQATFALDVPADVERLSSLIAAHAGYAARVQAAATAYAPELGRERRQRVDAYAQRFSPGALLSGVFVDPARSESHRVAFEIVAAGAATQTVTALLHNDGGWSEARPFQGEWSVPASDDLCNLTLRTRDEDRIDDAGPLLEKRGALMVVLQVRPDGATSDARGQWQLRCIDPAGAADVKAEFTRPVFQAMAATKPGFMYRGVAVSRLRQTTETVQLRFTEQDPAGLVLRAILESPPAPGAGPATSLSRPFRGTILGNTYRSSNRPIRLRSDDADRIARASQTSPFGVNTTNNSLTIALSVDGTRLVGEDNYFTYDLERVSQETGDRRQETAGGDRKSEPRTQNPEPKTAVVAATSGEAPASKLGEPTAPGTATDVSVANPGPSSAIHQPVSPITVSQAPITAAAAAAARPLFGDADVQEIILRSLKTFSMQPGAYVFFEGSWVPLPKNNGRWVRTLAQAANGKFATLNAWEDKLAGRTGDSRQATGHSPAAEPKTQNTEPKTGVSRGQETGDRDVQLRTPNSEPRTAAAAAPPAAYIMFDGRKRVPAVSGKNLTLLFVGELPTVPSEVLAKHPELKTYPLVEVAPMKTTSNGSRLAPLVEIAPGLLAFGPNRVDAMIETPGEDVAFLRCTVPLAPGRYALSAGPQSFD